MGMLITHIDIDVEYGLIMGSQDNHNSRIVYRVELPQKVSQRANAVTQWYQMSKADRSTQARIHGAELPLTQQGG